jgi:LuxR family transcriptional regulator, quorum-sensing system regulator SolR
LFETLSPHSHAIAAMHKSEPVNFDSETVDGLLSGWMNTLEPYGVGGVVVLAPMLEEMDIAYSVVAVHPPPLLPIAHELCKTDDMHAPQGDGALPGTLVDWFDLRSAPDTAESKWRWLLIAHGMRSVVRVRFRLPFEHHEECILFSAKTLTQRAQAAELAWLVLSMWPFLRKTIARASSPLSAREIECLRWASQGLTAAEAAQRIQSNARYVNYTTGNAMRRLHANSKMEAVFRAAVLGLL